MILFHTERNRFAMLAAFDKQKEILVKEKTKSGPAGFRSGFEEWFLVSTSIGITFSFIPSTLLVFEDWKIAILLLLLPAASFLLSVKTWRRYRNYAHKIEGENRTREEKIQNLQTELSIRTRELTEGQERRIHGPKKDGNSKR